MYELEQVSESLVLRPLGYNPSALVGEWRETPLMSGLDRLLREIGTYLEFVAIARGRGTAGLPHEHEPSRRLTNGSRS